MKKIVTTTITTEEDEQDPTVTINLNKNSIPLNNKQVISVDNQDSDDLDQDHDVDLDIDDLAEKDTETSDVQGVVYYVTVDGKRVRKVLTRDVEDSLIEIAKDLTIDIETRKDALAKLLVAYDRYIHHLVNKTYKYTKINDADLTQAAHFGFIEAVKSYDVEKSKGARLITYAFYQIKKYISRLIASLGYATKTITSKDASKARTLILEIKTQRDLTNQDYEYIASRLNNKNASWVRTLEQSLITAASFDNDNDNDSDDYNSPCNTFVDTKSDFATEVIETDQCKEVRRKFFEAFYTILNEREQDIIKNRVAEDFFDDVTEKATLVDLANKYGISNERIRQIESKAKEKLQAYLIDFMPGD